MSDSRAEVQIGWVTGCARGCLTVGILGRQGQVVADDQAELVAAGDFYGAETIGSGRLEQRERRGGVASR